jgi:uncharacterized protein (DUF1697 family)
MQPMKEYAAFLRGINSGKNPTVKMEVLRKAFEVPGFENVRTILASLSALFQRECTLETDFTDDKNVGTKNTHGGAHQSWDTHPSQS